MEKKGKGDSAMKTSHSTARNAAAVEKIFNDHYNQAKITAGAATRPGAQGSPTVWNELPAHTLHEPVPSPSPPSTYIPPSPKKPAKNGASTKERHRTKSRSRVFPQPSAGIEAFTDGDILAGKNIQPDWQRPSYRDIAHHGSYSNNNARAGEEEGAGGGAMLADLDEERLGPHKSRKPLQTSVSHQDKEFRALSERLFGVTTPRTAVQPLAPEALQKPREEEEEGKTSSSDLLGVGRLANVNMDSLHEDRLGAVSVSQSGAHDPPTTLSSSAPVKKPHRIDGNMDGRDDRTRGMPKAAAAPPTPPVTDFRSSSTPLPPAVETHPPYTNTKNEASRSTRVSPTPLLPSSAIERREREMGMEEVYPWRWRKDAGMQEILTEKKRLEAKAASVWKDPHRSNSAMKNAKRQHKVYIPSTKGATDRPLAVIPRLREGKYGVTPFRRASSDVSVYGRGGQGGDARGAAATRPYRAAPLPPGKLRQLSQQRKAQRQHEEMIRRYEETLPLRRMADPYVPRTDQREKVQDAQSVGVPNEYTLQVLSDTHHGLHPITGNAYRQQLLRGEPLIRRVLRGDFYNTAGAGEYAVPQYEDPLPPSVRRAPPTPPPTTAPPARPVSSQGLPRPTVTTPPLPRSIFPFPNTTAAVAANSSSFFAPPQWEEGKAVLGGGVRKRNGNRSRYRSAHGDPRYDRLPRVPPPSTEDDLGHGGIANERPQKKNFLEWNKAEVQKYSDRNTQYRYYREQMEARSKLPPRKKG